MRILLILMTATALTACGAAGPQTVGGSAVGNGTPGPGGTAPVDPFAAFVTPVAVKTYAGIGAGHSYDYSTLFGGNNQQQQIYAGNASTLRDSKISISFDPRDAIFELTITDPLNATKVSTRFQDPGSRTNFGGTIEPEWGVPNLRDPNIRYLQAGDGNPLSPYSSSGTGFIFPGNNTIPTDGQTGAAYQAASIFYEVPGSTTKYVTYAGYVRNDFSWADVQVSGATILQQKWGLERGAFVFGLQTDRSNTPKTGTATFTGAMLASMVFNPTLDGQFGPIYSTYTQWIKGTSTTMVDFGSNAVTLNMAGIVLPAFGDRDAAPGITIAEGTAFTASGTATINLVSTGGFTGQIATAAFAATGNGSPTAVAIAASSVDGAFFGPKADEVGGGFRIVGGNADQRIDIVGAFTGKGN